MLSNIAKQTLTTISRMKRTPALTSQTGKIKFKLREKTKKKGTIR